MFVAYGLILSVAVAVKYSVVSLSKQKANDLLIDIVIEAGKAGCQFIKRRRHGKR